jgi:predicted RNA binding protein YcfA (HicA-like mRNA interferase family)
MKARAFLSAIKSRGFEQKHRKGSHITFAHERTGRVYITSYSFREPPGHIVDEFSELAVELGEKPL